MEYKLSPTHIRRLRSLSPVTAVRLIITGEFRPGEDDHLIEAIRAGTKVNCDEERMWDILHDAMDDDTSDPLAVMNRLSEK